jgi:hypothetical protein
VQVERQSGLRTESDSELNCARRTSDGAEEALETV